MSPYIVPGLKYKNEVKPKNNAIIKNIIEASAVYFDTTVQDLTRKTRLKEIVYRRQIICTYLINRNFSYTAAGKYFGQDHTTVLHAVKKLRGYLPIYPSIRQDYENFTRHMDS
jgi:chromosomal replication initiation ATPase DnaA